MVGPRGAATIRRLGALILLCATATGCNAAPFAGDAEPAAAALVVLLSAAADGHAIDGVTPDTAALMRFYPPRDYQLAWGDDGQIDTLMATLAALPEHGIDPASFHPRVLAGLRHPADPKALARRDLLLSDAALRYAAIMMAGQKHGGATESDYDIRVPRYDPVPALSAALAQHRLGAWLDGLPPAQPQYRRLRQALARYRALAASGGWPQVPAGDKLVIGMADPRVGTLRRRLAAEGDLPEDATDGDAYDEIVAAAVGRFQYRTGLLADGVAGPRTLAQLNVTPAARVGQIVVTLERWRELARALPAHRIEVNAAAERLDIVDADHATISFNAIVGDARHPTPMVAATLGAVIVNPSWNVPESIAAAEIRPRLRRDPGYLRRQGLVIEGGTLRQRPGPGNALGRLKFDMPNRFDVYLHDTSSRPLFLRADRAMSHGCVRLDMPDALALMLLGPGIDHAGLDALIASGETRRLPLARPQPVYFVYWTAFVEGDDGIVSFRDDLYGRDARLTQALAELAGPHTRPPVPADIVPPVPVADIVDAGSGRS